MHLTQENLEAFCLPLRVTRRRDLVLKNQILKNQISGYSKPTYTQCFLFLYTYLRYIAKIGFHVICNLDSNNENHYRLILPLRAGGSKKRKKRKFETTDFVSSNIFHRRSYISFFEKRHPPARPPARGGVRFFPPFSQCLIPPTTSSATNTYIPVPSLRSRDLWPPTVIGKQVLRRRVFDRAAFSLKRPCFVLFFFFYAYAIIHRGENAIRFIV